MPLRYHDIMPTAKNTEFRALPHWPQGNSAQQRRCGFELELSGLDVTQTAELVMQHFGGTASKPHSLQVDIHDSEVGDFRIELDTGIGKRAAAELERDDDASPQEVTEFKQQISQWMGNAAAQIVPIEIVTPPLKFDQFPRLEALRQDLHEQHAVGTGSALLYAFGMQFNPQIPSEDVQETHAILRAFLVLYPWLKQALKIDPSRRILSFIDPFPERYVAMVLPPNPDLDWPRFMDDYLTHNPTRNRALDLLPLFKHLAPERLDVLDPARNRQVKARPTYHYRLPNCNIEDADWRIAREWNGWVLIETLAQDTSTLNHLCEEYLAFLQSPLHRLRNDWARQIEQQFGDALD